MSEKQQHRPQKTVLVIGRSGSGKSTLTQRLTKDLKLSVCYVNDRTNTKGSKQSTWEDAKTLSKCALVFEDVIGATKDQFKILQGVLAFSNHHLQLNPIYIIVHSVLNNNVHGLLGYVTEVVITAAKVNVNSLNSVLQYYRFDKEEKAEIVARFLRPVEPFSYYVLDVEKRTFTYVGPKGSTTTSKGSGAEPAAAAESMTDASSSANRFLALLPESGKALAIFDLIKAKLSDKALNSEDLTITLQNRRGKSVRISLIDYLYALTTPGAEPSREVRLLHTYISRKVLLPSCFVINEHFSQ